ncbi:MAG: ribosome silencing factor [Alphaproteobacteria bacterium]|nr:ribosome silencing factor [Alphaproteobacteria bacterium]
MTSFELAQLVKHLLDEKKAENIIVIDLVNKGTIVDYMVIATGTSSRQVNALADYVSQDLKQRGCSVAVEGLSQCDWALIDAGDVLVHIFRPESRLFYNLEKMWGSREPIDEINQVLPL